jgi:GTPase Era involved in 16S rRNA processing
MENVKRKFLDCIDRTKNILLNSNEDISPLEPLTEQIKEFKVIIPVVGMFSVGKSTLLNSLLGRNFLPIDTKQTTSIATELHFSHNERIEAYKLVPGKDNIMKEIFVETFNSIEVLKSPEVFSPKKYSFIKAYIDSSFLEHHQNIVLVDMPGLSSGLENHEKAIRQYLGKATNYIFVESKVAGTLTTTASAFLKEIKSYGYNIFGIINQIDQPSENQDAVKFIEEQMRKAVPDIKIGKTSAVDLNIDDLREIIQNCDLEGACSFVFKDKVISALYDEINTIQQKIECSKFDASSFDGAIKELESKKEEVLEMFERERKRIMDSHSSLSIQSQIENIKSKIKNALNDNAGVLLSAAMGGSESFNREVNAIVRPILLNELGGYAENEFSYLVTLLNNSMETMVSPLQKMCTDIDSAKLAKGIGSLFKTLKTLNAPFKTFFAPLAIMTNFIPGGTLVEVAIFFLPEIIDLIGGLLGVPSNEPQKPQLTMVDVRNKFIPQILGQLTPDIQQSLNDIRKNIINKLQQETDKKLKKFEDALKETQKLKEKEVGNFQKQIEDWNSMFSSLSNILKECE